VQKGDSRTLDSGTAGVQSAIWQNNTLWAAGGDTCTPPGDTTSRACLRFDEINTSGSPSLTQDVDAGEVGGYIMYPSVVLDQSANLYTGFSTSSSSQYPTASEGYFAGGSFIFPPGYNPAIDYQTGVGSYDCTFCTAANGDARNRWGDYSGAAQDPNNSQDVWLSEEFGTFDNNTDDWAVEPARFTAAAPVVGGLSPMSGYDELSSCHTTVTINGTDFQTGATVKFGGTNSASVNVLSPESLTASAPPKPAGTVDVTVQTPNGTSATSAADHFTYIADTTPPTSMASYSGANGAGWNNSDFNVSFTATDNTCGSGVKKITISATGAQSMSATDYTGSSATVLVNTEGITTFTYFATDNAGNAETSKTLTVKLDKTPPSITITTPAATSYFLHQPVAANYGCSDALSGLATCVGTVPNGSNIDTVTLGNKTFTVNATDIADNASTQSVHYSVTYKICLLYDPTQPVHNNQIPIKLEICDNSNTNLSSSGITLKAVSVSPAGSVVSSANPGNLFRFDTTVAPGGGYVYNLNVKGLSAGSYTLNFTVAGDPITHQAPFQLK